MATIKSYTDIEQSKKLAEIVPLDSADMIYIMYRNGEKPQNGDENLSTVYESNEHKWYWIDIIDEAWNMRIGEDIPCWSLAALLEVLPNKIVSYETAFEEEDAEGISDTYYKHIELTEDDHYMCCYVGNGYKYKCVADNPIDACYEMILKLHELNLL